MKKEVMVLNGKDLKKIGILELFIFLKEGIRVLV
jgi:hypothetical protein